MDGINEKIVRVDGVEICGYFLRGKMNRLVKTEKILTSSRVHDMPIGFKMRDTLLHELLVIMDVNYQKEFQFIGDVKEATLAGVASLA